MATPHHMRVDRGVSFSNSQSITSVNTLRQKIVATHFYDHSFSFYIVSCLINDIRALIRTTQYMLVPSTGGYYDRTPFHLVLGIFLFPIIAK